MSIVPIARAVLLALLAATIPLAGRVQAGSFPDPAPPDETLRMPELPPVPIPPGLRIFPRQLDGPGFQMPQSAERTPERPAEEPPKVADADRTPPPQKMLDDLFVRLATAGDADQAQGIAGAIERIWMRSASDTASLLMDRAMTAVQGKDLELAETLLTSVVAIEPDWAEAWNKRSTVRFLRDDDAGAMQDVAQVLVREPRHFGALAGMGAILQRQGMDKQALTVLRRALAVDPQLTDIRTLVDKLTISVEGRPI